jgi:hypothetical protein
MIKEQRFVLRRASSVVRTTHHAPRATILLAVFCFMLFAAGCGYTARSSIRASYQTIYITPFVNKIDVSQETYVSNSYRLYRPGLETDISKAVVDKYLFDGNLRPSAMESAGLVLAGELVEFRRDPIRYTDNDDVEEYRINIVVNLKLTDRVTGEVKWEENRFTGDTTYFTAGSQAKTETTAVQDALTDLARRIVERTVEEW